MKEFIYTIPIDEREIKDIINVYYEDNPCYDIVFEKDFSKLTDKLSFLNIENKKVMIVTETNVAPLYLEEIINIFSGKAKQVESFIFNAGEENKNLNVVSNLYEKLIINKFDRKDLLIALGGGVVGDLTGFTASTYLRGIDFIQIPTTLLSQVDSSVGGKTGVDFNSYKNMVGAFYMPRLVYMNYSTLNTLPSRDFCSGMGEVIKYGIIKDRPFFEWLKEHRDDILELNPEYIKKMLYICCNCKKDVVQRDPKEKGERALLNFGHTIGHAVEKLKNFEVMHGECVAIGMNAAAYLSCQKGYISENEVKEIQDTIESYYLPLTTDSIDNTAVVEATFNDKKMDGGQIKFISIKSIGNAFIDTNVLKDEMLSASEYIID